MVAYQEGEVCQHEAELRLLQEVVVVEVVGGEDDGDQPVNLACDILQEMSIVVDDGAFRTTAMTRWDPRWEAQDERRIANCQDMAKWSQWGAGRKTRQNTPTFCSLSFLNTGILASRSTESAEPESHGEGENDGRETMCG